MPKTSWIRYHGTGLLAALTGITMNTLNKSEEVRGRPAPGDKKNPHTETVSLEDRYETAGGRGIYSAADSSKALAYSLPYCPGTHVAKVSARTILFLRVPGALENTGVCIQMGSRW